MLILRILVCVLLTFSTHSYAGRAIFYQPQTKDLNVSLANWPIIFKEVKSLGIDTLIIQWSQYGENSSTTSQAWLQSRLEEAIAADLKLIVGLHADPELFVRLEQPKDILSGYFSKQRSLDLRLAKKWLSQLPADKILGWYIPLEIDDRRWRDPQVLRILIEHLQSETKALSAIGQKSVFISSFFAGNMSPDGYANMLKSIQTSTDVNILIQDGAGTGKLSMRESELYLKRLSDCKAPIAAGLVFEIFRQTQHDRVFEAIPLNAQALKKKLDLRAPCEKETVLFSLRYLIDLDHPSR